VLNQQGVTMDSPLVDEEGFPIVSIDIYAVRKARHDIICLSNDRADLTKRTEELMLKAHEEMKAAGHESNPQQVHRTSNKPFVVVQHVTPGGPAEESGLRDGDKIVQYGPLHYGNYEKLEQIAEVTRESENKVIRVTVIRDERPVRLEVTPHSWSGKGTLGCAFLPVTAKLL